MFSCRFGSRRAYWRSLFVFDLDGDKEEKDKKEKAEKKKAKKDAKKIEKKTTKKESKKSKIFLPKISAE